jgi:hypothetical protein
MSELLKVIQKNRETFYNYATNERSQRWPSYTIKLLIALVASTVCSSLETGFLGAVLTVYSILIGFSFNVLVYLLSFAKDKIESSQPSIEAKLREEKIHKLTEELFFNVSYFNLVSLALVVVTLTCFLTFVPFPVLMPSLHNVTPPNIAPGLHGLVPWLALIFRAFYFLLIVESLAALIRTIGRISFFFTLKSRISV